MNDIKAKKRLGQHFLVDLEIAKNIVCALDFVTERILEIGPGMGVLTQFLLQLRKEEIYAIELDKESVDYLNSRFPSLSPRVYSGDFLKVDPCKICKPPFSIIGNFPYNISSQILFKILDYRDDIPEIVGMFQKEVATRLASSPGNKDYGILSVILQAFYDVEYLFTVNENVFNPPPKVKSAVIKLKRNSCRHLDCDENLWKLVIKTAFNQRRKILRNSLKTFTFEKEFTSSEIFQKRPEQLSVKDFVFLTKNIVN